MAFLSSVIAFLLGAMMVLGTCPSLVMSHSTLHEAALVDLHEQWIFRHGRNYANNTEKKIRFEIFKDNVKYIEKFNKDGNQTYKLGINNFADLTKGEFLKHFTGILKPNRSYSSSKYSPFMYESVTNIPARMDWREYGAVSDIRDQGQCCKSTTT